MEHVPKPQVSRCWGPSITAGQSHQEHQVNTIYASSRLWNKDKPHTHLQCLLPQYSAVSTKQQHCNYVLFFHIIISSDTNVYETSQKHKITIKSNDSINQFFPRSRIPSANTKGSISFHPLLCHSPSHTDLRQHCRLGQPPPRRNPPRLPTTVPATVMWGHTSLGLPTTIHETGYHMGIYIMVLVLPPLAACGSSDTRQMASSHPELTNYRLRGS